MQVLCKTCDRLYDDATRWTICPHSPLGHSVDDLCPLCDTLRSRQGKCEHQILLDQVGLTYKEQVENEKGLNDNALAMASAAARNYEEPDNDKLFEEFWRKTGGGIGKLLSGCTEAVAKREVAAVWNDARELSMMRAFLTVKKARDAAVAELRTCKDGNSAAFRLLANTLQTLMVALSEVP